MANKLSVEDMMGQLIAKMGDGREDSLAEVQAMQKTLKNAMLKKNLKQHPALVQLLTLLRKRERGISLILENKEDLTQEDRTKLFARRKEVRFILSFFSSADNAVEGIRAQLEYQLSDDLSTGDSEE